MWLTPGSAISRRAIFSIVRLDMPVSRAMRVQRPLESWSLSSTYWCSDSVMSAKTTPVFGCTQPDTGYPTALALALMAKARGSKVVSHAARHLREAMVKNLQAAIAREYPGKTETAAYEAIGRGIGVSLSTMQRVMSGGTGPSIDTLADIAHHLGITVADLLFQHRPGPRPVDDSDLGKPRATGRSRITAV